MDFQKMVAAACSVEPAQQHFKAGFPPKPMPITDTQLPVAQWGLKNGDSLVLEGKSAASTSATPAAAVSTPAPSSAQASGSRAERSETNAPTSSAVGQSLPDGRCALHSMSATDSRSTSVLTNRVPWDIKSGSICRTVQTATCHCHRMHPAICTLRGAFQRPCNISVDLTLATCKHHQRLQHPCVQARCAPCGRL